MSSVEFQQPHSFQPLEHFQHELGRLHDVISTTTQHALQKTYIAQREDITCLEHPRITTITNLVRIAPRRVDGFYYQNGFPVSIRFDTWLNKDPDHPFRPAHHEELIDRLRADGFFVAPPTAPDRNKLEGYHHDLNVNAFLTSSAEHVKIGVSRAVDGFDSVSPVGVAYDKDEFCSHMNAQIQAVRTITSAVTDTLR